LGSMEVSFLFDVSFRSGHEACGDVHYDEREDDGDCYCEDFELSFFLILLVGLGQVERCDGDWD
jgi:hypothetical protein